MYHKIHRGNVFNSFFEKILLEKQFPFQAVVISVAILHQLPEIYNINILNIKHISFLIAQIFTNIRLKKIKYYNIL